MPFSDLEPLSTRSGRSIIPTCRPAFSALHFAIRVLRRLYYHVKPFVPYRLRIAFRRHHVRRILSLRSDVWPVREFAGIKPENWPGWPDGKKLALVLTHDVEGRRGLDRVKQLAELEMEFGFRSSFNFVPEGKYGVPSSSLLADRTWIRSRRSRPAP